MIQEDLEGTVVLFPCSKAVPAAQLTAVRQVVVLDGGWRECVRMNAWLGGGLKAGGPLTGSRVVALEWPTAPMGQRPGPSLMPW